MMKIKEEKLLQAKVKAKHFCKWNIYTQSVNLFRNCLGLLTETEPVLQGIGMF